MTFTSVATESQRGSESVRMRVITVGAVAAAFVLAPTLATDVSPRSASGATASATATQLTSRNWAGYLARPASRHTTFRSVTATWVQPRVRCTAGNAWAVFWVGLDGWSNSTVEQGGSSGRCVNGTPRYTLWWEMYPTNQITSVLVIHPGDSITATVTATATAFVITVRDTTTGRGFTKRAACASNLVCPRRSAEVVTEAPGLPGGGRLYPLADYASAGFTHVRLSDSLGHSGSLTHVSWLTSALTERSSNITLATSSKLRAKGTAFAAAWRHR